MSASCWSLFGKLVSSSTAFRFFALLSTFQSRSVGPVSPLIATDASPLETTKPQDSTGWLTGTDWMVYLSILKVAPARKALSWITGLFLVGMRVKSGQSELLKTLSRRVL